MANKYLLDSVKVKGSAPVEIFAKAKGDDVDVKYRTTTERTLNAALTAIAGEIDDIESSGATTAVATTEKNGLMSKEDKKKLNGIGDATPTKAGLITSAVATSDKAGLMSVEDKKKLDGLARIVVGGTGDNANSVGLKDGEIFLKLMT